MSVIIITIHLEGSAAHRSNDLRQSTQRHTLATGKMSVVPLEGFEMIPAVVLRLNCGSEPVHISGQHQVVVEEDVESEEEEDLKFLRMSTKSSAPGSGNKAPEKKVKLLKMMTMTEMRGDLDEILQPKMHKDQTRMEKRQNHQSTPR